MEHMDKEDMQIQNSIYVKMMAYYIKKRWVQHNHLIWSYTATPLVKYLNLLVILIVNILTYQMIVLPIILVVPFYSQSSTTILFINMVMCYTVGHWYPADH